MPDPIFGGTIGAENVGETNSPRPGATGQQGGAVAHALAGVATLFVPDLPSRGARLVRLHRARSRGRRFRRARDNHCGGTRGRRGLSDGIFTKAARRRDVRALRRQAMSGVGHLLYSSVTRPTGRRTSHFEQIPVEQHVDTRRRSPSARRLPSWKTSSHCGRRPARRHAGLHAAAGRTLQLVSLHDIGEFAASLVERRCGSVGASISPATR